MLLIEKPTERVSVADYLRLERAADERHTFLDGEVIAMAGESLPHGRIAVNLVISLGSQLKGRPCEALSKDIKVRSGRAGPWNPRSKAALFSYPDVVVVCGEVKFHDDHRDVILNPVVILEVLSPSTELFDRGEKFARFERWNPTLVDYLLVSQDRPRVEHFTRQSGGGWLFHRYDGLEAVTTVVSINCTLHLADLYDRVMFPPDPDDDPGIDPTPADS